LILKGKCLNGKSRCVMAVLFHLNNIKCNL